MPFSWAHTKQRAIEIKIRRAKTQAKAGHTDYKIAHIAEVRDAQSTVPKYTELIKRVKEETIKKQLKQETFDRKLHENG